MIDAARRLLECEARSIERASARLGAEFGRAVDLLADCSGKVIAAGMGKSGAAARKLAATLSATGVPAVFLHPAEAEHGDFGLVESGDVAVLISKSGTTAEVVRLARRLQEHEIPRIGILGRLDTELARLCDVVLDAGVEEEGDPYNLIPAASAIVATALGDALAVALMVARRFDPEHFGRLHPGGQLGRNLRLRVRDAMHAGEEVAWVRPETPLRDVVIAMTQKPLGAACVLDTEGLLAGLITDGDLRRALERHEDIRSLAAADVMTRTPVTIAPDALLAEALVLMERRPRQLSVLPVVDSSGRALGLLRLHDIYATQKGTA
ncbi:MAG: KpsF/GutQ family sugar-phosphate isomerase [Bryobacteraceae bacterium]|nr:KpsF/GutQ family sugar-phosphate isomerase [Bryobacteraceae bacterium]